MRIFFILILLLLCPLQVFAAGYSATGVRVVSDRWPDAGTPEAFGRDSARLAGAQHPEEEAIAVWRFIQQMTAVGQQVPEEPAYGNDYVLAPEKLLNVYGVHWCDGLSRLMTMTWRAMGYRADKLYKFGHTLANCWWRDRDGVMRDHVFDLSQHWYVYDRTGTHIATADELALDHSLQYYPSRTPVPKVPSPMEPSYVHAGHLPLEPHPMAWNLRQGERVVLQWENEGKPYQDLFGQVRAKRDFEHGPYPLTYGNGRLVYRPDLKEDEFFRGAGLHENLTARKEGIMLADGQERGEVVIPFSLPYILADVRLSLQGHARGRGDSLSVSLSTDGGANWKRIWTADKGGSFKLEDWALAERFNPAKTASVKETNPFGRYDYLLRVEMARGRRSKGGPVLERLEVVNTFQHNIFALPMLWPGENGITAAGRLAPGAALRIAYEWDDAQGEGRQQEELLRELPAEFPVLTEGERWQDVRCRTLTLEMIDAGATNAGHEQPQRGGRVAVGGELPYPTERSIGSQKSERLAFGRASADLEDALDKRDTSVIADRIVALAALQDPRSESILQNVVLEDDTAAMWHKELACQALYQSVGERAAPFLMRVMERDPAIAWRNPRGKWSADAMWLHTMATVSAILGDIEDFPQRERAGEVIAATLRGEMTEASLAEIHRGKEIAWGLIRNLGRLGDAQHVDLLISYLPERGDAAAVAAAALTRIGDADLLPRFIALVEEAKYPPLRIAAIHGIGKFGGPQDAGHLQSFLDHWDESFRAAAAEGLGELGNVDVLEDLESALRAEEFPWVREIMRESIAQLR